MKVLARSKEQLLTNNNKYILLKVLSSAVSEKGQLILENTSKALTLLRMNEDLIDFNQDVKVATSNLFQAIDKNLRDKKFNLKDLFTLQDSN